MTTAAEEFAKPIAAYHVRRHEQRDGQTSPLSRVDFCSDDPSRLTTPTVMTNGRADARTDGRSRIRAKMFLSVDPPSYLTDDFIGRKENCFTSFSTDGKRF